MYMEDVRVQYQYPAAFGDQWDHHSFINGGHVTGAGVLPNITHQYFDCTRQAAASATGVGGGGGQQYNHHQYHHQRHSNYYYADHSDQQYRFQQPKLITDYNTPPPPPPLSIYRINPGSVVEAPKRIHSFKEPRKLCRVCDAVPPELPPIKPPHLSNYSRPDTTSLYQLPAGLPTNPKAVDEDLYKIPPEYLRKNRRAGAKLLNFFSKVFRFRPHFGC